MERKENIFRRLIRLNPLFLLSLSFVYHLFYENDWYQIVQPLMCNIFGWSLLTSIESIYLRVRTKSCIHILIAQCGLLLLTVYDIYFVVRKLIDPEYINDNYYLYLLIVTGGILALSLCYKIYYKYTHYENGGST